MGSQKYQQTILYWPKVQCLAFTSYLVSSQVYVQRTEAQVVMLIRTDDTTVDRAYAGNQFLG